MVGDYEEGGLDGFYLQDQASELHAPTRYRSPDHDPVLVGLHLHAD